MFTKESHIEDGHTDGSHGRPSNLAKAGGTLVLLTIIGGIAHLAGSILHEKFLNYKAAEEQRTLEEAEISDVTGKIKSHIRRCNDKYRVCDDAINGEEDLVQLDDHDKPLNSETISDPTKNPLSAFTNTPRHTKCTGDRVDCLEAISHKGKIEEVSVIFNKAL